MGSLSLLDVGLFRFSIFYYTSFVNYIFLGMCPIAWNFQCICIMIKIFSDSLLIICRICITPFCLMSGIGTLYLTLLSTSCITFFISCFSHVEKQLNFIDGFYIWFRFHEFFPLLIIFFFLLSFGVICLLFLCSWNGYLKH